MHFGQNLLCSLHLLCWQVLVCTGRGVWACGWANSTHLQLFNDVHITPSFNLLATCTVHTLAINCSCGGAVHLFRGRSWELCSQLPPIMGTSRRQPMFMLIHVYPCAYIYTHACSPRAAAQATRLVALPHTPTQTMRHMCKQCATRAAVAREVRHCCAQGTCSAPPVVTPLRARPWWACVAASGISLRARLERGGALRSPPLLGPLLGGPKRLLPLRSASIGRRSPPPPGV